MSLDLHAPNLDAQGENEELLFHLKGILEVEGNIRKIIEVLDRSLGKDQEKAATALSYLYVEIFHHLLYHMKCTRAPLRQLTSKIYEGLPDLDPDQDIDWSKLGLED